MTTAATATRPSRQERRAAARRAAVQPALRATLAALANGGTRTADRAAQSYDWVAAHRPARPGHDHITAAV